MAVCDCNLTSPEVVGLFMGYLIPIKEVPKLLGYSPQYGRRLILAQAVFEVDCFDVHGRYYVTQEFVDKLRERQVADANR